MTFNLRPTQACLERLIEGGGFKPVDLKITVTKLGFTLALTDADGTPLMESPPVKLYEGESATVMNVKDLMKVHIG